VHNIQALDAAVPVVPPRAGDILPLVADGLVFEAGGRRLIDGIDLTLLPGARTVVLGPNGAGKSLLLRLLHGLIRPTAGRVTWNGRSADAGILRRQAMVFQKPVLLRRSVAANIDYALKVRGLSRAERGPRVTEMLRTADLDELAVSPARVLSGGEQQRLSLARALATRPEILFLDEPTASLDPGSTQAIELADEVVFIHRGRVAERTAAFRFFQSPVSKPATDFLAGNLVF
jgi:tungstate transport system ATP-binding protein